MYTYYEGDYNSRKDRKKMTLENMTRGPIIQVRTKYFRKKD